MATLREGDPLSANKIRITCRLQAREYLQLLNELVGRGLLEIREDKSYILTSKGSEYLRETTTDEARHPRYSDFIAQRNLENWLDMNRELALFIHQGENGSREPAEIHGTKFGAGANLTKTLGRGVDFGALGQFKRFSKYYLSAKAQEYLESSKVN